MTRGVAYLLILLITTGMLAFPRPSNSAPTSSVPRAFWRPLAECGSKAIALPAIPSTARIYGHSTCSRTPGTSTARVSIRSGMTFTACPKRPGFHSGSVPMEIDPRQPRVAGAPLKSRLRHYLNLDSMYSRLDRLIADFAWGRMDDIFLGSSAPVGEIVRRRGEAPL